MLKIFKIYTNNKWLEMIENIKWKNFRWLKFRFTIEIKKRKNNCSSKPLMWLFIQWKLQIVSRTKKNPQLKLGIGICGDKKDRPLCFLIKLLSVCTSAHCWCYSVNRNGTTRGSTCWAAECWCTARRRGLTTQTCTINKNKTFVIEYLFHFEILN